MKLEDIEARYKAANLRELAPGFGKVFGGTDCLVVGYRDSMNGLPGRILCVVSDRDSMNKEDEAAADLIASLPDLLAIAQGQREEIARLKRLVKMALLEGVAICTHREDLTEPWENGERAWNGSKASEEVNMAIGTKK